MLGKQTLVAFIATTDEDSAVEFYRDTLGLRLVSDDAYAIVFDANGVTIRMQKVDDFEPQPFTALGWAVKDIAKVAKDLKKRGVKFLRFPGMDQNELGVWASPSGARVAWFKDPDGNTLSLTQLG